MVIFPNTKEDFPQIMHLDSSNITKYVTHYGDWNEIICFFLVNIPDFNRKPSDEKQVFIQFKYMIG